MSTVMKYGLFNPDCRTLTVIFCLMNFVQINNAEKVFFLVHFIKHTIKY